MSPVIQLENVGKCYRLYNKSSEKILDALGFSWYLSMRNRHAREFWALRRINLVIEKGERVGIIGRNGSGKSTLLKIICGTLANTEGRTSLTGKVQAMLELGTGFHPEFTGRQNIRTSLALQGLSPTEIGTFEDEIIDFSELDEFIDQPIKTYSAGMHARLAFSTATVINPDILIIDEVLGAGDAYFNGKCVERMRRLTIDSGATVLFVSHDLGSIQTLCDRVIWIDRGSVRQDGQSLEIIKAYSSMIRREEELRLKARDRKINKSQYMLLNGDDGIFHRLLFHFTAPNVLSNADPPRIRSLRLLVNSNEVGQIMVGAPMDNSTEHHHYLIDDINNMSWGPARIDEKGYYRSFFPGQGKYQHAPFEFAIPRSYNLLDQNITIEVTKDGPFELLLEVFDGEKYVAVSTLASSSNSKFSEHINGRCLANFRDDPLLPDRNESQQNTPLENRNLENIPSNTESAQDKPFEYGSRDIEILKINMINESGSPVRIFETGSKMAVVFDFIVKRKVTDPIFVFCIYLPDGKCASQWISGSAKCGKDTLIGPGTMTFQVDRLMLGRSSYVASAAIFRELRTDGMEGQAYHVMDRTIHFQVVQPQMQRHDLGLCLQPFTAKIHDAHA